jgi:uncharacterized protein
VPEEGKVGELGGPGMLLTRMVRSDEHLAMHTPSHCVSTRFRRSVWVAALLTAVFLPLRSGAEKPEKLQPQGYVNDFAGILDASATSQLADLCREVDHTADAQIAIVTINSLEDEAPSDFAVDLAQRWGVGPKQKDRGVLILLATADHKYWVTVGYGLEGILPDGKVGGFGREMVPLLRQDNYGSALLLLTQRIAQVIADDRGVTLTVAPGLRVRPANHQGISPIIPFAIFCSFFILVGIFCLFFIFFWLIFPSGGRPNASSWSSSSSDGSSDGGSSGGDGGGDSFGGGQFGGGGAGGSW